MENISSLELGVMSMISEISLNFAIEMARKLHSGGTPMGLAIYKSSKYYNVDKHQVALQVGKMGGALSKNKAKPMPEAKKQTEQSYWWDNL